VVAAIACRLLAWRASRAEPNVVLRDDSHTEETSRPIWPVAPVTRIRDVMFPAEIELTRVDAA